MAAITEPQHGWRVGARIRHVDGFANETDVSDVDCEPPTKFKQKGILIIVNCDVS